MSKVDAETLAQNRILRVAVNLHDRLASEEASKKNPLRVPRNESR